MKQQVFVIHGGHPISSRKKYLEDLRKAKVSLDDLRFRGWKKNLGDQLGKNYEVLCPQMPTPQMARYAEWQLWFEKFLPLLQNDVIFVGHSLGGAFLAKYLSEKKLRGSIRATFLVATPFLKKTDFKLPVNLKKMAKQAGQIFLYHSMDDTVVPFESFEKFRKALSQERGKIFQDRGHFLQEELLELVADIRSLTKK